MVLLILSKVKTTPAPSFPYIYQLARTWSLLPSVFSVFKDVSQNVIKKKKSVEGLCRYMLQVVILDVVV